MRIRKVFRFAAITMVALVLAASGFVLAARCGWLTPTEAELRNRYALPQSNFPVIGGQSVHLVDEGKGPAILLIHGSAGSLRMWEDWVIALKDSYRVIRFDRPAMGLTGPSPDARYSKEAEMALIDGVVDRLALDKFVLVSTSSGGEAAATWAAQNSEQIVAVIFSNIASGPIRESKPDKRSPIFRLAMAAPRWLGGWQSRFFWRGVLEKNFADPEKVTPELVREWSDLANRTQRWKRVLPAPGHVYFADTPDDLAAITSPALVLWSAADPETTLEDHGRPTFEMLGSPDKTLEVVPNCGHMMPIECGRGGSVCLHSDWQ